MSFLRKRMPSGRATFVLCFALLFLFLRDSDLCFSEMKRGLSLCSGVLVPTLFPYMIISEMLIRAGLGYYLGKFLDRPMRRIFGIGGSGAGAVALGIICGFPIGSKTAAAIYSRGELTRDEFERLLAFCNYPSAPFVIFAVGKSLLGSTSLGIFIYCITVITGLLFGALSRREGCVDNTRHTMPQRENCEHIFKIFTDSTASAAGSVISICALVTFFTCFVGCLSGFDCINSAPLLKSVICSFFELTSGAAACAALDSRPLDAILTATAVGWSGVSVIMQIYSTCNKIGTSPSLLPYIKSRLTSSVVCAISTAVALCLFPTLAPNALPDTDAFIELATYPSAFIYAANILFVISLALCANKKLDIRQMI